MREAVGGVDFGTSQPVSSRCPICEQHLVIASQFATLPRVTSDCRPWPSGGELGRCSACGAVGKPVSDEFRTSAAQIYRGYAPYAQGAGSEQRTFDRYGASGTRSSQILTAISDIAKPSTPGMLVDFGCGTGVFIREFLNRYPSWGAVGVDSAQHLSDVVSRIDGASFAGDLAEALDHIPVDSRVIVSMIHSLEHLEEPAQALRDLIAMYPTAVVVVQVPDNRTNFFDVAVADHRTHFTRDSLGRLLGEVFGPESFFVWDDVVSNELTAIASAVGHIQRSEADRRSSLDVNERVEALQDFADEISTISSKRPIYIFGSSIAASWIAGCLPLGSVAAFLDEDVARIGRRHLDIPIIDPSDLPSKCEVVLPFRSEIGERIASRLNLSVDKIVIPSFASCSI